MYSPKINPELVTKLYQLKQKEKKPMTKLANEAVAEYIRRKKNDGKRKDNTEVSY